jgi:hypothetical protein
MITVTVYTREIMFDLDLPMKALIPSFDPSMDSNINIPRVTLGERFSFEVELPHGYQVENLAVGGYKRVTSPEGRHLDVFDVMTRVHKGTDGFRLLVPPHA